MSLFVNEPIAGLVKCKCGGKPNITRNRVKLSAKFNAVAIECQKCGDLTWEHLGTTDAQSVQCAVKEWERLYGI